jgi:hypothetical protein
MAQDELKARIIVFKETPGKLDYSERNIQGENRRG